MLLLLKFNFNRSLFNGGLSFPLHQITNSDLLHHSIKILSHELCFSLSHRLMSFFFPLPSLSFRSIHRQNVQSPTQRRQKSISLRLLVAPTVIIDDSFLRWNICLLFYFQSFRHRLSLTKLYIYFSFEMRGLSFLVYIFSIGFWSKHTEIKPFFSLSSDTNWRGVDVAAGTLTCIFPSSKQNDAVYIL